MKSRHHLRWVIAALLFGAPALPYTGHATGLRVLGPDAGRRRILYANYGRPASCGPAAGRSPGPALLTTATWRGPGLVMAGG